MLRTKKELLSYKNKLMQNRTEAEKVLYLAMKKVFKGKGSRIKPNNVLGFYIVDFYFRSKNLVIEVDGSIHDTEKQKKKDIKRDAFLKSCGFNILRFTNDEVLNDIDLCISKISSIKYVPSKSRTRSVQKASQCRSMALKFYELKKQKQVDIANHIFTVSLKE